jgi:hypothetical protein
MRSLFLLSLCSIVSLFPGSGKAGDSSLPRISVSDSEKHLSTNPNGEIYRGHFLDFSEIAGRQEFAVMADALRHQIDIVDGVVGLSPHVLEFFRKIPIFVNEEACLNFTKDKDGKDLEDPKALLHPACYSNAPPESSRSLSYGSVWDSTKSRWVNSDPVALAVDTNLGVIMVRPVMLGASSTYAQRPVMLHELLHAYHNRIVPRGFKNAGILLHYNRAKDGQLYPAEAYLTTNEREFFAVTASVFLYGNDGPITRPTLKEKQPDYYKYLVYVFGFDPDRAPSASPVASAY